MATKLNKELAYDAGIDAVNAMLMDPAFREKVLERQRVLRGSVTVDGNSLEIEQVLPATGIPAFAKKFVGDEIVIRQHEQWATPTRGDIRVTMPGKPGEMKGTATLTESGGRTVETIALEVRVGIPLVGGKLEALIGDLLSKALDKEHQTGVAWLAEH